MTRCSSVLWLLIAAVLGVLTLPAHAADVMRGGATFIVVDPYSGYRSAIPAATPPKAPDPWVAARARDFQIRILPLEPGLMEHMFDAAVERPDLMLKLFCANAEARRGTEFPTFVRLIREELSEVGRYDNVVSRYTRRFGNYFASEDYVRARACLELDADKASAETLLDYYLIYEPDARFKPDLSRLERAARNGPPMAEYLYAAELATCHASNKKCGFPLSAADASQEAPLCWLRKAAAGASRYVK